MIKSLIFKEWIKSRWILLIILIVFAGVTVYTFMNVSRGLRMAGGQHIWEMIVQKGITFASFVKYIPLLAGILLALAQYIPEMANKRLKLTLHLPLEESKVLLSMLFFGVVSLSVIFVAAYSALCIGFNHYFCTEVAQWNMDEALPWFLGGLTAYLLTSWVCIEPVWKQRVFNSIIAVLSVWLFYFDAAPEAYSPFLCYLVILIVLSISFSFYSLIRFKDGEQ